MPFFSPLPGQPKNMAIIHSAISYVSARDLRLFNCRINNSCVRRVALSFRDGGLISPTGWPYFSVTVDFSARNLRRIGCQAPFFNLGTALV
jgi:hypothetical protein